MADMFTRTMLSPAETRAADQAAAWFARQRSGPLSDADAAAFAEWLKSDPLHTKSWAVYQQIWTRTDAVRDNPRVLAMRENARRRGERRKRLRGLWRSGLGLAAAALLGIGVWWSVNSGRLSTGNESAQKFVRNASTEIGEHSLLLLPDGSKVTLNTASAIHTDYSGSERRVTLVRGEAFFDVAKDRSRPFIVAAGTRQVIAVGTAFNVRLQEHRLRITLVEGKVRVVPTRAATAVQPASAVTLEPNSVLLTTQDGVDRIEHLDAVRDTSWREGKLIFDGERLAEVVSEMNRYSRQKLIIANAALEGRRVSGVFEPGGAPTFAKALEAYGIARAVSQTPTAIVLDAL